MLKKTKLNPVFSLIPYISNERQRLWTSASPHANILKVWVETEHVLICIKYLWRCFLQLKFKKKLNFNFLFHPISLPKVMWPNRQVMYRGQKYWVEAASLCPKLTKTSDWLETPYKSRSVKKQRFCFITCNVSIFLAKHLEPHIYINADFYFFFSVHRWILWWENELQSMDLQVLVGQLCSGCFCSSSLHAKRGYPAVWSKSSHQTLDKKEKSCSYFLKCLFLLSAPVENGLTVPSLPDLWKIWAAQQKCSRFRIFPSILLAINLYV